MDLKALLFKLSKLIGYFIGLVTALLFAVTLYILFVPDNSPSAGSEFYALGFVLILLFLMPTLAVSTALSLLLILRKKANVVFDTIIVIVFIAILIGFVSWAYVNQVLFFG
jgi:threonine/homoserine/homoserine lactone efflux protein